MTKTVAISQSTKNPKVVINPGDVYFLDIFDHKVVNGVSLVAVYNKNKNLIGYASMMNFVQVRHR